MDYIFFLRPFLLSLLITLLLCIFFIKSATLIKLSDFRSGIRHVHKEGISRLGGIAVIIGFFSAVFFDSRLVITQQLMGVVIGCLLILIIGIFDDLRQLSWKTQLLLQIFIAVIVLFFGVHLDYISNPLGGIISFSSQEGKILGFLLVAVWIIFFMNALNWVDGIDGLSGGVTAIGAVTIFFLSMRAEVNQPPVAIISVAVFGAMLAFLLLNFYPAKIMAGTSGSMFMGFILAVLAIFAGAKIATTLLVMIVPIIDACWVIYQRFRSGKSIFLADKRHLHYRLMKLGLSQRKICMLYYIITALVAYAALNSSTALKLEIFFLLAVVISFSLVIINKKTENEA